jgi:hypothetical protein
LSKINVKGRGKERGGKAKKRVTERKSSREKKTRFLSLGGDMAAGGDQMIS